MKDKVIGILRKLAGHENIFLTQRGNKAILTALKILKNKNSNKILIPDQGAWITYSQYAKKIKFGIEILKTDYGVIDLSILKNKLKNKHILIYSNPAAYYAIQPVKKIYDICKKNGARVILDITGCIGSDYYDGNYADIIVCSFGKSKPVNLGYGGFLSTDKKFVLGSYLDSIGFEGDYGELFEKLKNLKRKHEFLEGVNKKIKDDLKHFNVLHKDKKGINVIVMFDDLEEKNMIIKYCEKNRYEFVVCPKNIKVNEEAISIEVKRLE